MTKTDVRMENLTRNTKEWREKTMTVEMCRGDWIMLAMIIAIVLEHPALSEYGKKGAHGMGAEIYGRLKEEGYLPGKDMGLED